MGRLLELMVLQGKQVVQAVFYFSDDLKSTVANPSCFSNLLQPQNLLQPAPSPVGEGWGEGILQIAVTFPNTPTTQNTSLAACCPLSSSLPRGERTGWLLGLKGSARKTGCADCFFVFQTTFINAQFRQPAPYNFQKSNQNQSSATVQTAFPIPATRAGFLPAHRLSAAKFRDSKNAAR